MGQRVTLVREENRDGSREEEFPGGIPPEATRADRGFTFDGEEVPTVEGVESEPGVFRRKRDHQNRGDEVQVECGAGEVCGVVCLPGRGMRRGDFDLSEALAKAVAGRQKVVTGELRCQGRRKRGDREFVPCQRLLRYRLNLSYD